MLDKLRNIGIIAHVDAGKTTTTERILYYSGTNTSSATSTTATRHRLRPPRTGEGHHHHSAAVSIDWGENQINIIDTPGHVDFTAEVTQFARARRRDRVFCAVGGVEVQSETVWFQSNKYKVPRIAYVNKLDRLGADFKDCVEQMKAKLQCVPAICMIPLGFPASSRASSTHPHEVRLEGRHRQDAPEVRTHRHPRLPQGRGDDVRQQLLETAALADDELMELVLDG